MARTAPGRRVSWPVYWRQKLDAAPNPLARFGEASDYFRSACRRHPDQAMVERLLKREGDRLEELAKQLSRSATRSPQ